MAAEYCLIPKSGSAENYLEALRALRQAGEHGLLDRAAHYDPGLGEWRPRTLRETISDRVASYQEVKKGLAAESELFTSVNDTCTAIALKAKSDKIKIIPRCKELITAELNLDALCYAHKSYKIGCGREKLVFMHADYNTLDGYEISRKQLKLQEPWIITNALKHPVLLYGVEEDQALLKAYFEIIIKELNRPGSGINTNEAMPVCIWGPQSVDSLLPLCIDWLDYFSVVQHRFFNEEYGRFVAKLSRKGAMMRRKVMLLVPA